MCRDGIIEVEAIAFIQGRIIPKSIIILDEEENISPSILKLMGSIKLPDNYDYKKELTKGLAKKYKS
jgi:hypothetical protein